MGNEGKVAIFVICLVVLIGLPTGLKIYDITGPGYQYNNEVHSHMQNAYDANTPALMKSQLEQCEQGMHYLGLTPDMYGAYWPWEKTPDKQMVYQYQHLDSILVRVDAVQTWYDEVYMKNSTTHETLGDVYEIKMDNLRAFLKEDSWSDWIAQDAYYANFHVMLYTAWYWAGIIWVIFLVIAIYAFFKFKS